MENKTFSLRWNHHQDHLLSSLAQLLSRKELVDITIWCNQNGKSQTFEAHKIVLATCSKFFADIFNGDEPGPKSFIVLEDVKGQDFGHLLHFMYHGKVDIPREDLDSVLSAAQFLKIKGLIREEFQQREDTEEILARKRKISPRVRFLVPPTSPIVPMITKPQFRPPPVPLPFDFFEPPCLPIHPIFPPKQNETFFPRPIPPRLSKTYTNHDMDLALDCLKEGRLSLTRASEMFKIPATTLWQRANKLGIATPKKESVNKTWSDSDLDSALDALRKKEISANKASKRFGIPSSTLYKIARKEGIELAQPFNAITTSWSQDDLSNALKSIKNGVPVQKAAAQFNIPTGTLYGRCKKGGIELSKTSNVLWSEDDMNKALEVVKVGDMSINQAAIHFNLPYSSLYGRICKLKRDDGEEMDEDPEVPCDLSL